MNALRPLRDFFVSLRLTVVLLALGLLLILWATLSQVDLGVWGVQTRFFRTFLVVERIPGTRLWAPYPGGYIIGGLLLINLVAAHIYRFQFTWRKAGIQFTHIGLILLLVGELLAGLWQQEFNMRLIEGEPKNYAESYLHSELAFVDTSNPAFDDVVAIPESRLAQGTTLQHPKLPFRVAVKAYYPNAAFVEHAATPASPRANAPQATAGVGLRFDATPEPPTYKENESNIPTAYVELIGSDGSIGTWLVASHPNLPVQTFEYGGKTWKIALRPERAYKPFTLTLLKFSHDVYAGTDIPKNFSSRIRLTTPDGRDDREVLIYMNNPLRYAGLTFYQASFEPGNEKVTILQVVRNPSWVLPYVACAMMAGGLLWQFGLHLFGFIGKRRQRSAVPVNPRTAGAGRPLTARTPWSARIVVGLALLIALSLIGRALMPPKNPAAFDLVGFGRLPVLANGRIKPLDTVARSSLLQLQGKQYLVRPDAPHPTAGEYLRAMFTDRKTFETFRAPTPIEWLLDVCFRPELADNYQVFEIVHPEVLAIFDLKTEDGRDGKRFSFNQLAKAVTELERQTKLADQVDAGARNSFQRAVVQLYGNLLHYQRLRHALVMPGQPDFLGELLRMPDKLSGGVAAVRAKVAGQPHDEAAAAAMLELAQQFEMMAESTSLLVIPPADENADPTAWKTAGAALLDSFQSGRINATALAYAGLAKSWREQSPEHFNTIVSLLRGDLAKRFAPQLGKSDVEARFNAAEPFYVSMNIYALAFVLAIVSWLVWPEALGRTAFWLVGIAWVGATAGILTRMWLEGRPPVTNLYSSALFIGWGAVALCLFIEFFYRNAIGSVAAGVVGFATLLIAHHLSLSGDTLEMMRAVLDSNFWLGTHVVVVTLGYASTFLAGFLALIYVFRGVFSRTLDKPTADALARMVYGIVCFATLFSFTGTVLGGIWADQSWGRFWGWDPKENGALIIVIWNAIILHARWGGMIRQRGLMTLAIGGNMVTSWSWFGTNMLGVGLHSYGFTDAAFWSLAIFWLTQIAAIAIANLPLDKWRSFGPALKAPPPEHVEVFAK